jgi:hypothetical protein
MDKQDHVPGDMRQAIVEFSQKAQAIVDSFRQTLEQQPSPGMIYHYTNDVGLRGIIETGRLWFTDIFDLNDHSELMHGVDPALEAIEEESRKRPKEVEIFSRSLRRALQGGIERTANFFVCCFSKTEDDLGQWRAYADNGRGYALGFDRQVLENAFGTLPQGPFLMAIPLCYGEMELREVERQIIAEAVPLISMPRGRKLLSGSINEYMLDLSVAVAVHIVGAALFFKHKAYSNEQEYRFLQMYGAGSVVPDLKYRSRAYSLVRYREFDWRTAAAGALKRIIVGPAADKSLASRFASDCLHAFHLTPADVSIGESTIPYRVR